MKKTAVLILVLCIAAIIPAAAQTGNNAEKILVIYFSKTGTTRQVAEHIHSLAGGDMAEITAVDTYPGPYNATLERARQERDKGVRPAIRVSIDNLDSYGTIFLGYPIWFGNLPMLMVTFLESYDLSGKTILPFCTSGSSGISQSAAEIRRLAPKARVTEGLQISGSGVGTSRATAAAWLRRLGVIQ